MTNLDDKCWEGSERGRTETEGKAGTRPGQVPPCHPGPDAHPATQVQMQDLTLVAAPSGQQRKSSELKGATRSLHTPCRHRSQPQHRWSHPK